MSSRTALYLSLALVWLSLALATCAIVLTILTWDTDSGDLTGASDNLAFTIVGVAYSLTGAVVAYKRPANRIGWLFLALGILGGLDAWFSRHLLYTLEENPETWLPSLSFFASAVTGVWVGPMSCSALLLLLFPQGKTRSTRWRMAAWAIVLSALLGITLLTLQPGPLVPPFEEYNNQLGIAGLDTLAPLIDLSVLAISLIVLTAAVSLFRRFLTSTGDEREQIKWFAYSALWIPPLLLIYLTYSVLGGTDDTVFTILNTSLVVVLTSLPVAVGIAVLKYRLYDIDVIVNRTLVYVPLTAILAGLFTATTALTRTVFTDLSGQGSDAAIAATTIAIVGLFTPVKNQLQSFVDRLFKEASDPAKPLLALTADARKVFGVLDAEGFLQDFADKAVAAMGASNALVYLNGKATPVIVSGDAMVECVLSFPLVESGTHVGRLEIGPSSAFLPYSPKQVAALEKQIDVLARGLVFYAAAMGLEIKRPDQNGPGVTVSDELGVL